MKTKTFAAILLVALVAGVIVAWAVTTWQGSITWTIGVEQFSVYAASEGGEPLGTGWTDSVGTNIDPTTLPITYTKDFYLQNDGTVDFTVTAIDEEVGCVGEWSDGGSYLLTVGGARIPASLTLTINGDGDYSFEFNIAP